MSHIPNPSSLTGPSPGQSVLQDAQFSSYVRKQSVSAYESLDAGLTIQTKEGDTVTLTSSSYAQFDAFMYNSKGIMQTESGTALVTQNQKEITLASGESFTFSVVGDLSKEELGDIADIIKGIDEIISEMAKGDMDDAVATALSMGGYDSVSMFSADITYQRSYAMTSEIQAQTAALQPESKAPAEPAQAFMSEPNILPEEENSIVPSVTKPFPENHSPHRKKNNTIKNIDNFVERMGRKLEKIDDNLVDKVQKPIDKLFNHHLKGMKNNHGKETSAYTAVDTARKKINTWIDQIVEKSFKDLFSSFKA